MEKFLLFSYTFLAVAIALHAIVYVLNMFFHFAPGMKNIFQLFADIFTGKEIE